MILVIVSSDPVFWRNVTAAVDGYLRFESTLHFRYEELARLHEIEHGQKAIVVIDFAEPEPAMTAARMVDGRPLVCTIVVGAGDTRDEVVRLMNVGVRDVLPYFSHREVLQAANRVAANLGCAGELIGDLYAFMPAKPGCGASTLATYAAATAAGLGDDSTLLLDFDIRLGVSSFLLKSEGGKSIIDALMHAGRLDENVWNNLVSQHDNLHVLGSGPIDFSSAVPSECYSELLDYVLRRYSMVTVDLPGAMEQFECEVLMRAKKIFLVCTPDVGALHVARRKTNYLQDLRLADKVSLVLNSLDGRAPFTVDEIERIIQLPVRHQFPSSSKEISNAAQKGIIPAGNTPFARKLGALAGEMVVNRPTVKKSSPVRRLVEYFSISSVRRGEG